MKTKIINSIPFVLLYSRLVTSVLIIVCSFIKIEPIVIISLSVYAIVSDVLDGIIARYLKISTQEMRQMDTKTDTVFWFSCLFYISINHHLFLTHHLLQIGILVFSEFFIIVFGFLKFQERISYHTIVSKFWALILLWFFIDLILNKSAENSFFISFWYGIFVQIEIITIAFILKKSETDVPSVFHAFKLKKGIEISKNRLFNG